MALSPVLNLSRSELAPRWKAFFENPAQRATLRRVADAYPQERSVLVEFLELEKKDTLLADELLRRPETTLAAAEVALQELLPSALELPGPVHVRVTHLSPHDRVPIHQLREKHLNRFLAVDGIVRRVSQVLPQITVAVYECSACHSHLKVPQETTNPVIQSPTECDEAQGGCGKPLGRVRFRLLEEESQTVDYQRLELQENPEMLRGGAHPEGLTVVLLSDLVGQIVPGTRLVVNGVLKGVPRPAGARGSSATLTVIDTVLVASSLERQDREYLEIEISDEERRAIEALRGDPSVFSRIVASLAPSIAGMEAEKQAIGLQLFGGVAKYLPDGVRVRGDVHILMVGDPGVAKSQLLRYVADTAPRGLYTSGKGATAAGLTAAAVRDDFAGGRWVLEAGAMVLADGGMLCIDEMDKMSESDRSSMHEAMEQQTVSVAKAGITVTLRARCPVLAAANPKLGRFVPNEEPQRQFNLPPTLLSRFDIILVIQDIPDQDRDRSLAEAILTQHQRAEDREAHRGESTPVAATLEGGLFTQEFLRKYIAYARQSVHPKMNREAYDRLKEFYTETRKLALRESEDEAPRPIPVTPRQLEALIRLTEASARSRLSAVAGREDAERAVQVVNHFLQKAASVEGRLDIDTLYTGVGASQRDQLVRLRQVLSELQVSRPQGFQLDEAQAKAKERGIPEASVERLIGELVRINEIYSPRAGFYRMAG
jgi:replicative DNA helicase Mcm